MGWFMPKGFRTKQRSSVAGGRLPVSRVQPVVEKLEDRTAPAVALFNAGTLSLQLANNESLTLQNGLSVGTQLNLVSNQNIDYSQLPSGMVATVVSASNITLNLDLVNDDVNHLLVDFGSASGGLASFGDFKPSSLLNVTVQDATGASGNQLQFSKSLDLTSANGNFSANLLGTSVSLNGSLKTGKGTIQIANQLAGSALTVSSTASPQLDGSTISLDFRGEIGNAANPLKVRVPSPGLLQVVTQNYSANLQAVGSVKIGKLDLGTGTATLRGAYTSVADSIGDGTTLNMALNALLIVGGQDTIGGLSGPGQVSLGANTLTLAMTGARTFDGILSGTAALNLTGAGTQTLTGSNTFNGSVAISPSSGLVIGSGVSGDLPASTFQNEGTLTFSRTGTLDVAGQIRGAGSVAYAGGATYQVSGANDYTGGTSVTGNTVLVVKNSSALGGSSGKVLVGNGSSLVLNGSIGNLTIGNAIQVQGQGVSPYQALHNLAGNNRVTGGLTLTGATSIGREAGTSLELAGGVTGAQKADLFGQGTLILSKQSTSITQYIVHAGTVVARASGSTGTGSVEVMTGAGLVLDGTAGDITLGSALILNGNGQGNSGVLSNIAGNNTVAGKVTMASGSLFSTAGGTGLTLKGGVAESAKNTALTLAGTGTLNLAATGSYTGVTTVLGGTLVIQKDNAAGTGRIDIQAGASLKLEGGSQIGNPIQVAGTGVAGKGAIQASGKDNIMTGSIQLLSNTTIGLLTLDTVLLTRGIISESKSGTNLSLSGPDGAEMKVTAANTYTGSTSVSGAALVLGDGTSNGSISSQSIVLSDNGGLAVLRTDSPANPFNLQAVISGAGGFAVYGGNVLLSAANTYTGNTEVWAGTSLVVGPTGSIANSSLINVMGDLEFQQSGSVVLAGKLEGTAPGSIVFGGGGSYLVGQDGTFSGQIQVDSSSRLTVNGDVPDASVNLDGTLDGTGTVGQIQAGTGSMLMPGVSGAGVLTSSSLSFPGSGSQFVTSVRDDGSNLVSTILTVTGAGQVDLNNTELVIQSTQPLNSVGTILYLVDFTGGGSVQSGTWFTDSQGNQIQEGDLVEIAPGLDGKLLYNFGPDSNDVVLLITQNYSTFTYTASTGKLDIQLAKNTNLSISGNGASSEFVLSKASSSPVFWVQFGGDAIPGATANTLPFSQVLKGLVSVRQDSTVSGGTNLVQVNGPTFGAGGLAIQLDLGDLDGISIGTGGLAAGGDVRLVTGHGSITQQGAVDIAGSVSLTALNGVIELTNGSNLLGGAVTVQAKKAELNDSDTELRIANALCDGLVLGSAGAIRQDGPLYVFGQATLTSANGIFLANRGNDLNQVSMVANGDVDLFDSNALTIIGANALSGYFSVESDGALGFNLPDGVLQAGGDITLGATGKNAVSFGSASSNSLISDNGSIEILAGSLEFLGNSTLSAKNSVQLPATKLGSNSKASLVVRGGSTIHLLGSLLAEGVNDTVLDISGQTISLEAPSVLVRAYSQSGVGEEVVKLGGKILAGVTQPQLTLDGGSRVEVKGDIGTAPAKLGNVEFLTNNVFVVGEIQSAGAVTFTRSDLSISLGGAISAQSLEFAGVNLLQVAGNVVLGSELSIHDSLPKNNIRFEGKVQSSEINLVSLDGSCGFMGSVQVSGDVHILGAAGGTVTFASELLAGSLLADKGNGDYQIRLLGDATIRKPVSLQNGGVLTLGDQGNEVFNFDGGIGQVTGGSVVLATGLIWSGGAVSFSGLQVNGSALAIVAPGKTIQINGPADIGPGLTLKGAKSILDGDSILTTGVVGVSDGPLTLGAGISGFTISGSNPVADYTRLVADVGVAIGSAELQVDLGSYKPVMGSVFTLVENKGGAPVSGIFKNLPEGATFSVGNQSFVVSYQGGDGNDITLRTVQYVPPAPGPIIAQPFNLNPAASKDPLRAQPLVLGIGRGQVLIRSANGSEQTINPFPFFLGPINVATADRNGDGIADSVVAMVAGAGSPQVLVIDGNTGRVALSFYAFAPQFKGGGSVASSLVNLGGEVVSVIAVGAGSGGNGDVTLFNAVNGANLNRNFYAFENYKGSITVAMTPPNGADNSLLVVAADRNSHVNVWDLNATGPQDWISNFYAFSPSPYLQQISVAGAVFNGADNKPFRAIVVGAAQGWPCSVAVFDLKGNAQKAFYAFDAAFRGGVRVGAGDVNKDGKMELLAGTGPGIRGDLRVFNYETLALVDEIFASETTEGLTVASIF